MHCQVRRLVWFSSATPHLFGSCGSVASCMSQSIYELAWLVMGAMYYWHGMVVGVWNARMLVVWTYM